jgi:uncharacterized protein
MTHIRGPIAMEPMTIDEASIVSGEPVASGAILYTTPDGRGSIGLYRCTPGRFRYTVEAEDFTHLLAGHIVIETDDGETIDAKAGDTYVLPAGKSMMVDVRETITDVFLTWSPE